MWKSIFHTKKNTCDSNEINRLKQSTSQKEEKIGLINKLFDKQTMTENLSALSITNEFEKLTSMKYKETIFDSMKDDWKKDSSTFDSLVLKKEKLLFYIETTDEISIGGFMKKKIMGVNRKIGDVDCFLFTNRNKQMKKYQIKSTNKFDAFQVFSKQDPKLFTFGNDLTIYKEDMKDKSTVNERGSFFNYGRDKNALLGKVGTFEIKRIRVIQLE